MQIKLKQANKKNVLVHIIEKLNRVNLASLNSILEFK